jgi:hypothetical protein
VLRQGERIGACGVSALGIAAVSDLFVVHKKQGSYRSRKHEEHFEEKAKPVKTYHAAKSRDRFAGLGKEQADNHGYQQPTSCEPAYITSILLFPKRFYNEQENTDHKNKYFREDRSDHRRRIH